MAATYHQLLHHLFRPTTTPRPSSTTFLSLLLLKPTFSLLPKHSLRTSTLFSSLSSSPIPLSRNSLSPPSLTLSPTSLQNPPIEDEDEEHSSDDYDDEIDEDEDGEEEIVAEKEVLEEKKVKESAERVSVKLPSLSVKEKKELASYAHGLGDKLKSQLVGKSGVTASVAAAFFENLESNELLKIKIHRTCPGELPDVVKQLEEATASVVVSQIGRTVILYKPSLTKLKAEEKKMQNRKVFVRKSFTLKPTLPSRKNVPVVPRLSGRGNRGSSRV